MALVDNAWYVNFGNGSTTGYYGVTAWAASATKVCGNLVRQLTAPAVGSERVFVCIASTGGTGTTGGAEPTWTVTRGAKNTDNTVTWQEATGVAALNGDLTNTPNWNTVKNTAVTLGQVIKNVAGTLILICTTAGTAGNAAEPSWAAFTNAGATTADNTVTWTTLGASFSNWAAPHARLASAMASTWGQVGNAFYVGDNHAETQSSAMTIPNLGTPTSPVFVYCVDHTASVPPGSGNLLTTATISTTGNSAVNLALGGYCYGITFTAGSGANAPGLNICNGSGFGTYEQCVFVSGGTNNSIIVPCSFAAGVTEWINCNVQFGATGSSLSLSTGRWRWRGSSSSIVGATLPTTLVTAYNSPAQVIFDGIDLSALGSGKTIFGAQASVANVVINECKLGASVTVAAALNNIGGPRVDLIRCDSGATNYRDERYYLGCAQTVETTIVRTGGATDGTTPISWKLVTSTITRWLFPFESQPMAIWNDTSGSSKTVTVYGIWGGGAVPNNDDIWIEVEYLGSSATPLGSLVNDTKSNNLATGSALTSDGSTWGGSTTAFAMSVTFTPQMKGPFNIVVKAAKASTTFYIDPAPIVT